MKPEKTRERRPAEARRAQILGAAVRCIADKGFHTATMDDVARAAGLSKGSLYWHFKSKDDVFLALCDEAARASFEAWDRMGDEGSVLDRFSAIVEAAFDHSLMELRPVWAEFFAHPACRSKLAELYRETRALLADELARQAGGSPDLQTGPAAVLLAAIEGLGLQAMVDPEFDLHAHWEAGVDSLRRGFG